MNSKEEMRTTNQIRSSNDECPNNTEARRVRFSGRNRVAEGITHHELPSAEADPTNTHRFVIRTFVIRI